MKILYIIFCIIVLLSFNILISQGSVYETRLDTDGKKMLANYGVKDVDKCLEWSFGKEWKYLNDNEKDNVWNRMHQDLFKIYSADSPKETFRKIAEYCNE